MVNNIVLVRHGVTRANEEKRYAGMTDFPLTPRGERQASSLTAAIGRIAPDALVSSPLQRAMRTADLSAGALGIDIATDPDLREVDFGEWENLTFEEISMRHPDGARQWIEGATDMSFPGGESMTGFAERVSRAMERLMESRADTVMAFTHGGVIGFMLCLLLRIPTSRHVMFRLPPASITTLKRVNGVVSLTGIWDIAGMNGDGA